MKGGGGVLPKMAYAWRQCERGRVSAIKGKIVYERLMALTLGQSHP